MHVNNKTVFYHFFCFFFVVGWLKWSLLDVGIAAWLLSPSQSPEPFSQLLVRFGLESGVSTDKDVSISIPNYW